LERVKLMAIRDNEETKHLQHCRNTVFPRPKRNAGVQRIISKVQDQQQKYPD
jgi:hypothetical protein